MLLCAEHDAGKPCPSCKRGKLHKYCWQCPHCKMKLDWLKHDNRFCDVKLKPELKISPGIFGI